MRSSLLLSFLGRGRVALGVAVLAADENTTALNVRPEYKWDERGQGLMGVDCSSGCFAG